MFYMRNRSYKYICRGGFTILQGVVTQVCTFTAQKERRRPQHDQTNDLGGGGISITGIETRIGPLDPSLLIHYLENIRVILTHDTLVIFYATIGKLVGNVTLLFIIHENKSKVIL